MKVLAEAGIDILNANTKGVNALHLAVKKNYVNILHMLLKSKFPPNLTTDKGMTAVALAA